jgi:hypothetical protein
MGRISWPPTIGMNVSTDFYASVRSGIDAAEYLMRDLGKKGQNELPEGFTKPGRWWGQLGGQVEALGERFVVRPGTCSWSGCGGRLRSGVQKPGGTT